MPVRALPGCGVNVLNPPPILSLAQLLPTGGAQSPPTMERTLAAIMARFDRMWAQFVAARGSFEPFMDLYLDRWLHSYVLSRALCLERRLAYGRADDAGVAGTS